jgi:hypothetical protein
MSEGTVTLLFYVLPLVVLMFLPTLLALFWRRDRLLPTLAVNLSAFFIGPIGTLLAIGTLVVPKEVLERILERLHAKDREPAARLAGA